MMVNLEIHFQRFIDSIPVSKEFPCAYFPGKLNRTKAFLYNGKLPEPFYEYILNQGFRRSGSYYYQNHCQQCRMCLSYRVLLNRFLLTKSQKRILKRNFDLKVHFRQPHINQEKEKLYIKYQYFKHFLKPLLTNDKKEFNEKKTLSIMNEQMYENAGNSIEMEIFLKEKLLGFAVFDMALQSLSAVYAVYDPEEKRRSLGTFMILKSIEWARERKNNYYHLGFFIPGHPKMDYKSRFKSAEIRNPQTGFWEEAEIFMKSFGLGDVFS